MELFLNQREAARAVGLSVRELRALERRGGGPPAIVLNRKVRKYPISGLQLFMVAMLSKAKKEGR